MKGEKLGRPIEMVWNELTCKVFCYLKKTKENRCLFFFLLIPLCLIVTSLRIIMLSVKTHKMWGQFQANVAVCCMAANSCRRVCVCVCVCVCVQPGHWGCHNNVLEVEFGTWLCCHRPRAMRGMHITKSKDRKSKLSTADSVRVNSYVANYVFQVWLTSYV